MSQNSADTANDLNLLSDLVDKAKRAGADAADAVLFESVSLEVSYRLGAREDLERSESKDLGLRIFFGKKQAIVSSTDMTPASLDELLERGLAMAAAMPEDPYCGLADTDRLCTDIPDLDLNDPGEATPGGRDSGPGRGRRQQFRKRGRRLGPQPHCPGHLERFFGWLCHVIPFAFRVRHRRRRHGNGT